MLEKRLIAVAPQSFLVNGGTDGKIIVANAGLFKVKQQIIVAANTLQPKELEIKRIEDINTIYVGPKAGNIDSRENISAYTVALGAAISAIEQKRPSIPVEEIARAEYEEEPTVARRVILVDKFGKKYDDTNPLPTSGAASAPVLPQKPLIVNVTITNANTETLISIPAKTQYFQLRISKAKSPYTIKTISGGPAWSCSFGEVYNSPMLDPTAANSIYIECLKANTIVELFCWQIL